MELVLRNIMWFSLIVLLLALTVAVIQIIIILLDVRGSVREFSKRLNSLMFAGLIAGIKKGIDILRGCDK
ncbi:MAG: hypothetical protein WC645_03175 [Candidatus Margulisiibacteriota bacterium]